MIVSDLSYFGQEEEVAQKNGHRKTRIYPDQSTPEVPEIDIETIPEAMEEERAVEKRRSRKTEYPEVLPLFAASKFTMVEEAPANGNGKGRNKDTDLMGLLGLGDMDPGTQKIATVVGGAAAIGLIWWFLIR